MTRKLWSRVVRLVVVLWLASLGTFLLVGLLPGDAAVAILGPDQPAERYVEVREELGLERPMVERYGRWLGDAVTGDLGSSLVPPSQAVTERVASALPVSIELAAGGMVLALVISVPLALWSAHRSGKGVDRLVSGASFAFLSIPSFLVGLLLILVFVKQLGLLPRAEWVRPSNGLTENLRHALLPMCTIALTQVAVFTRVLRADLITTLQERYIEAARAKGMPAWRILVSDALRPSSFSLVTVAGVSLGQLIGSTVIVETLFGLPGMGTLIVGAAQQRDVKVVQGAVLVIAALYVVMNTIIDISYGWLDPRLRRRAV